jgi:two-component system, LuxR family, response regulator FixJ
LQDLKTIAIVDDEEEVRLSLGSLLRAHGHEIQAFESAGAFLKSTDLFACDCLVTDVHMPGTDGIQLLEILRARGGDLPVIVISALDPERTRARAIAAGADAYLSKPVDPNALWDGLQRLLPGRGAQRKE